MRSLDINPQKVQDDPSNPNRMDEQDFTDLVQAIDQLGFLQPVLVREDEEGELTAVDGHHRLAAARSLGLPVVPAIVLEEGDPAYDRSAIAQIGMNKLRGELDLADVAIQFSNLQEGGFDFADLALTGFSEEEITELIATVSVEVDEEDLLAGTGTLPATEDGPSSPFVLEIEFHADAKAEYQACRKAIKRAAGKGAELSAGLKILCGVED